MWRVEYVAEAESVIPYGRIAFGRTRRPRASRSTRCFRSSRTGTGGGLIRDVLTNTQPMILCGQVYATAALLGSLGYASLRHMGVPEIPAELVACLAAFSLRASAIIFNIRMGPPGEFIRIGKTDDDPHQQWNERRNAMRQNPNKSGP